MISLGSALKLQILGRSSSIPIKLSFIEVLRTMKPQSNAADHLTYWKDKYLDSLDEAERKEKEWEELESVLHRSIARLAVAGYGVNPQLDRKLDELRTAVRRGHTSQQLEALIKTVSDTAVRLKDPEQAANNNPLGLLATLLDDIEFPGTLRKKVKRLKKQLSARQESTDLRSLVHELKQLLREALESSSEHKATETTGHSAQVRPSLLARFLASDTPSTDTSTESTRESTLDARVSSAEASVLKHILEYVEHSRVFQEEVEALKQRIDKAGDADNLSPLIADIVELLARSAHGRRVDSPSLKQLPELPLNQVLLELLVRLDVPDEMTPRIETLKARLEDAWSPDELPSTLESIAALITDMRRDVQREREEIEQFLKRVTDRLVTLDANLQQAERSSRESLEDGQDLGNTVREQVTQMRTSVAEAEDLEQLKHSVNVRLDAVQERMETYISAEESRIHEADHRIRELATQLREVEAGAQSLQKQIQQERAQAIRDGLTNLYNRIAYDERIQQEFAHWKRYRDPLSLLLIDIDHFKSLNDTYGHLAGDKALATLAKRLHQNIRETDFLARYGGEEFIIIMPRTKQNDALTVAEKLREMVEQCAFHFRTEPVRVTISCGIAEFHDGDDPESVFRRSDEALYQAKRAGRNRCCVAQN